MSKPPIKITETLMLRRIDPIIMLTKYLNGDFRTVTVPTHKVSVSSAFINLGQRIGTDSSSRIYRFSDKSNLGQIIVTTNHDQYQHFKDTAKDSNSTKDGTKDTTKDGTKPISLCPWCRREILDEGVIIPIAMEVDKLTGKIYFYGEEVAHSFGCGLSTLKYLHSCHHNYKDPLYMDADQMLHLLYYKMHPDKIGTRITEAKHWKLLESNQGPLSEDEYDSDQLGYRAMPNIVMCPIKRQYVKFLIVPPKK